jgi:hypothetical protein
MKQSLLACLWLDVMGGDACLEEAIALAGKVYWRKEFIRFS